ncbi:Aminodeoxychorismate lyase [Pseudonocardia sp. Ae707_Ps1]|nr:Aminodeoxychorismate lyase [Pseudonocardia sp. Ae707_Ps1]
MRSVTPDGCDTVPAMAAPSAGHTPGTDDDRVLRALATTGYGHFTTMLVTDGRVRGLDLHLDRLARDSRALFGTVPDRDAVCGRIRAVAPGDGAVVVRVSVADPALGLATIGAPADPRIAVTARPAPQAAPPPLRVRTVGHQRYLPEVKSVGLFPTMHLRRLASRDGFDDVLLTDGRGTVLEGSTWNVGFVAGNRVVWAAGPVLAGVTRTLLRDALREPPAELPGVDDREETVRTADLPRFEAAFATNATGIRPIAAIDDTPFPTTHPVLTTLTDLYASLPTTPIPA